MVRVKILKISDGISLENYDKLKKMIGVMLDEQKSYVRLDDVLKRKVMEQIWNSDIVFENPEKIFNVIIRRHKRIRKCGVCDTIDNVRVLVKLGNEERYVTVNVRYCIYWDGDIKVKFEVM